MTLPRQTVGIYGRRKAKSFRGAIGSGHGANRNRCCPERDRQRSFKIPHFTRDAAEQVEAERPVLRERVTGEMRFREQAETGNAPGVRELVPLRLSHGAEL